MIKEGAEKEVVAAIMAGGASRRMGRDKAALEIDGVPMLERVARAALDAGLPAIVVGRGRPAWWSLDEVRFVPDGMPGAGPLGGLLTALRATDGPVLALACDMPMMTGEGVRWLVGEWNHDPGSKILHGAVALSGGRLEPLFAIYEPACRPLIEELMERGERSLQGFIRAGMFSFVEVEERGRVWLNNINVPGDLDELPPPSGISPQTSPSSTSR